MYKKSPENRMAKNGDMIKEMSNFLPFYIILKYKKC